DLSADTAGAGSLPGKSPGRAVRRGCPEAQRHRLGHAVPDSPSTRIGRLVCQPVGGRRSRQRRPAAPPALSSDTEWAHTRERGFRELRPRSASMNKGDGLAHWLVQRAARSAPPVLSERLEEEWLADMHSRQSAISRLRLAIGCCWATRVIA